MLWTREQLCFSKADCSRKKPLKSSDAGLLLRPSCHLCFVAKSEGKLIKKVVGQRYSTRARARAKLTNLICSQELHLKMSLWVHTECWVSAFISLMEIFTFSKEVWEVIACAKLITMMLVCNYLEWYYACYYVVCSSVFQLVFNFSPR